MFKKSLIAFVALFLVVGTSAEAVTKKEIKKGAKSNVSFDISSKGTANLR